MNKGKIVLMKLMSVVIQHSGILTWLVNSLKR